MEVEEIATEELFPEFVSGNDPELLAVVEAFIAELLPELVTRLESELVLAVEFPINELLPKLVSRSDSELVVIVEMFIEPVSVGSLGEVIEILISCPVTFVDTVWVELVLPMEMFIAVKETIKGKGAARE